ncbi:MAG: hypothetical protein AAFP04_00175 [Myxococcota bacterium]
MRTYFHRIAFAFGLVLLAGCGSSGSDDLQIELCNNGVDDTGDGLIDCASPSCSRNIACARAEESDAPDDGDGSDDEPTAVCGDGIRQSGELCDGGDLGGSTCESINFMGGSLGCNAACSSWITTSCVSTTTCGNEAIDPGEACDGAELQGASCESAGFARGGILRCRADCTSLDTGACLRDLPDDGGECGDGVVDEDEVCDGAGLAGASCESRGYEPGGQLACDESCQRFDESGCSTPAQCGDDVREGPESCDGSDLGNASCASRGFDRGELSCTANCNFDTRACRNDPVCGDGVREGDEVCDANDLGASSCATEGFASGSLSCNNDCDGFDTSACIAPTACDDGTVDDDEVCDGDDFEGATCRSLGYRTGSLRCTNQCQTIDTSGCSGDPGYDNGSIDVRELCDGPGGPFLYASNSCATFGLGDGEIRCGPQGPDFSGCRLWSGNASIPADYCELRGYYGDGEICDPCEAYGGRPDPDCDAHCGDDGVCADLYSYATRQWGCDTPDPDCGQCGDGVLSGNEICDGDAFDSRFSPTCEAHGFVGGTVTCRDDCTLNLSACNPAVCGNGIVEGNEVCDGGVAACSNLGYGNGSAPCRSDCRGYVESSCRGLGSCGNGRIDGADEELTSAFEFCDGDVFFSFGGTASAASCSTFALGSGTVGCTANCELDFSGCNQTDICEVFGMRGDGKCDLCERFGGAPDPDCNPTSATYGCGFDGQCGDQFDTYTQRRTCGSKGLLDPDCGYCGNDLREVGEFCDGEDFGVIRNGSSSRPVSCQDYGYTGGSLKCAGHCVLDLSGCTGP